jgi:hypothetical protein
MQVQNLTGNTYFLGAVKYQLNPGATITVIDADYNYDDAIAQAINALDEANSVSVSSTPVGYPRTVQENGGSGFSGNASDVVYDNTESDLSATDVQAAIDELALIIFFGGVDQAQGITPSVSSTGDGSAASITDGNDSSYWKASSSGPGNTVTVDLGTAKAIAYFRVKDGTSGAGESHAFTIESSDDNSNWTTYQTLSAGGSGRDTGVIPISGVSGSHRYWRIRDTSAGANWWGVNTFSLYII